MNNKKTKNTIIILLSLIFIIGLTFLTILFTTNKISFNKNNTPENK